MTKRVYVIMENDWPAAVTLTEERAAEWIAAAKAKDNRLGRLPAADYPRISRVIHLFEVLE